MAIVKDKRGAILAAALKLIAANGFHGTPMSQVAREAGVSAGIIYHYFESKVDLIDELYRVVKHDFAGALLGDYQPDLPVREQLRRFLRNAIYYFMRHPQETVFMEQFARSPYNQPEIQAAVDAEYRPLYEMIARAQQQQIIKDLPEAVLHTLTLDVASSVVQKHAAGALDLTDPIIEQIVEACWDAVRR